MHTMYSFTKSLNEANVQSFVSDGTSATTLMQFLISPTGVHGTHENYCCLSSSPVEFRVCVSFNCILAGVLV